MCVLYNTQVANNVTMLEQGNIVCLSYSYFAKNISILKKKYSNNIALLSNLEDIIFVTKMKTSHIH